MHLHTPSQNTLLQETSLHLQPQQVDSLRQLLKQHYPHQYALMISARLLKRKALRVSRQQLYNYFNHLPVSFAAEIYCTAWEMVLEAETEQQYIIKVLEINSADL